MAKLKGINIRNIVLSLCVFSAIVFSAKQMPELVRSTMGNVQNVKAKALPIYSVETDKKQIALTFDAAWGNEDTEQILRTLSDNGVKATFFVTGEWVDKYPEDVKLISSSGHNLGNHSQNHKKMSELSVNECEKEIQSVHSKIKELTGIEMILFRAPYGDYNDRLVDTVRNLDYYCIQWDVDSLDWKGYDEAAILNRVCNNKALQNGSIILMHNGGKYTAKVLDKLIKKLKENGYELVTVSELIYKGNYEIDVNGKQHKK